MSKKRKSVEKEAIIIEEDEKDRNEAKLIRQNEELMEEMIRLNEALNKELQDKVKKLEEKNKEERTSRRAKRNNDSLYDIVNCRQSNDENEAREEVADLPYPPKPGDRINIAFVNGGDKIQLKLN